MAHNLLLHIISGPAVFVILLLLIRAAIILPLERKFAASPVDYRRVWPRDIGAWTLATFAIIPIAGAMDRLVLFRPSYPGTLLALPFAIRFLLFLLITDFFVYWAHRLMHTRYVWRIHKWHHSPPYMYWLAGTRGSLLQAALQFYCAAVADGILFDAATGELGAFVLTFNALRNDWGHMNVRFGNKWVEWFVITPRYHRIHHSDDPAHFEKNLAATFPIFDRLFGTYFDPAKAPTITRFGIDEPVRPVRMALGI